MSACMYVCMYKFELKSKLQFCYLLVEGMKAKLQAFLTLPALLTTLDTF